MSDIQSWVAFLDLLGTKDSSKLSQRAFGRAISQLHNEVAEYQGLLSEGTSIDLFTDCAAIETQDIEKLLIFLDRLRVSLFSEGFFFKCAVMKGSFSSGKNENEANLSNSSLKPEPRSSGITIRRAPLYGSIVKVYEMHEAFKGIGFVVSEDGIDKSIVKELLVKSFYLKESNRNAVQQSYDIRYFIGLNEDLSCVSEKNVDPANEIYSFISCVMRSFVKAKITSRKYGRYYVPLMVSLVSSADFSKMEYSDENNQWEQAPHIFHFINNDDLRGHICGVVGGENVIFSMISRFIEQRLANDEGSEEKLYALSPSCQKLIVSFLGSGVIQERFATAPAFVVSHNVKDAVLAFLSDIRPRTKRRARMQRES